jgi:isoleucyl-tRNA synthetase
MRRTTEIFDSWVEAGSMPFSEYHYPFENKKLFESRFPAQFVAEYIAQTRAWFYVMHVISLAVFGKAPFENVVTTGTILAEDGSKMSKSKNNYPDPWEVIHKYGVDALRFYLMSSTVMQAENLNFSVRELEGVYRKVVLILRNVENYLLTYGKEAKWQMVHSTLRSNSGQAGSGQANGEGQKSENVLDKWIFVRTQELVNDVTECLDRYDTVRATRAITEYIDDLSTWYLRRSRGRTEPEFFETLYDALMTTAKVIAPLMPYLAEIIYRDLRESFGGEGTESVHLAEWPFDPSTQLGASNAMKNPSKDETELLSAMAAVRAIASAALAARKQLNIPVRQPLQKLEIRNENIGFRGQEELIDILKAELNVRDIMFSPKLSEEVALDTVLTDELRHEGLVRALERVVQEARKQSGLKVGEMAKLAYSTSDENLKRAMGQIDTEKTYIQGVAEGEGGEEYEIEGQKIKILLTS